MTVCCCCCCFPPYLNDLAENLTETHLQGVSLLLEQSMTLLCTGQTGFHQHLGTVRSKNKNIIIHTYQFFLEHERHYALNQYYFPPRISVWFKENLDRLHFPRCLIAVLEQYPGVYLPPRWENWETFLSGHVFRFSVCKRFTGQLTYPQMMGW